MNYKLPEGVKLEVMDYDIEREDRQDSAFYTWSNGSNAIARLTFGDREYSIECVGEMRIYYQNQTIRYCDDLIKSGFTNDKELAELENKGGEWINNSWFEVYDHNSNEYTMEIYHEVKDAIESVANWITEEVSV